LLYQLKCDIISSLLVTKHSNVPSVSGPSVAVGPWNNVPAGPPSHRPWEQHAFCAHWANGF